MSPPISATALAGLPEIAPGDDLTAHIADALERSDTRLEGTDVLVVAHKIVSKAEGRIRPLKQVHPTSQARELAEQHGKDPRHVQLILEESRELLRAADGVLICVTHHGLVCANAGVDAS